jgi:hypothetical protein
LAVKLPALIVIRLVPPALICASSRLRAAAERDERDDRRHAVDHAKHGQNAVRHLVRASAFKAIRVVMTGDMGSS